MLTLLPPLPFFPRANDAPLFERCRVVSALQLLVPERQDDRTDGWVCRDAVQDEVRALAGLERKRPGTGDRTRVALLGERVVVWRNRVKCQLQVRARSDGQWALVAPRVISDTARLGEGRKVGLGKTAVAGAQVEPDGVVRVNERVHADK